MYRTDGIYLTYTCIRVINNSLNMLVSFFIFCKCSFELNSTPCLSVSWLQLSIWFLFFVFYGFPYHPYEVLPQKYTTEVPGACAAKRVSLPFLFSIFHYHPNVVYLTNITFIFYRFHCSSAAVTPAGYEGASKDLTCELKTNPLQRNEWTKL